MKRLFTFLLTLAVLVSKADQTFINSGSSWKFLDNGTDQGTAWKDVSFSDNGWPSGNAQLGYGEGDEATIISYGPSSSNKYITYYFRKTFTISNLASFVNFQMNVKRDDGVVVYVNGVEAWRNNMGTGTVLFNTLAAADASDDGQTFINSTLPASLFVNGNNVVAVEIHQFTVNSSDLSFDLNLTGISAPPPPVVIRGAYLSLATPNSIYVRWRTDVASDTKVLYGTDPQNLNSTLLLSPLVTDHIAPLTGLQPNTKYYYSIGYSGGELQYNANENFFVTPPVSGTVKPTRMWVTGDMGTSTAEQNQVRDAYYNYTGNTYTDLWLWLGDNAYLDGTETNYQDHVFVNHYEKILKQTVVWPAAGNHDLVASNASTQSGPYYDMFNFPTAGEAGGVGSGTKAYYSYNYANIHFVVLESTTGSFRANGGAMQTWLQNDLAANNQKWTVVYFHHPPYSMGSHNSDTESQLSEMRTNFNPIIEQYKVDLVLCGHSHNYERTFLIKDHFGSESTFNNTHKINGGSGAPSTPYIKATSTNFNGTVYAVVGISGVIEGVSPSWPHEAMQSYSNSTYGSMVIDVNGDTLDAKLIDNTLPNPNIFDQFRIIKQCDQAMSFPPLAAVCQSASPITLSGATPAGGTYSGTGVSAGIFDPSVAGTGTHTISYTYSSGFCTNTATQTITVNALPSAVITPSGPTTVCSGTVTLNANTGPGLSYQWKKDGTDIPGATLASYSAGTSGSYTVVVTSTSCSTTSSSVAVSVGTLAAAITPAGTTSICAGNSITLSASTGTGYTYKWYRNNVLLSATTPTYTTTSDGTYKCVITSGTCSATTNSAVVKQIVNPTPTISYTTPLSFCAPGSVSLTANSFNGVVYQWEKNSVPIPGANSQTYIATDAGLYRALETANGCSRYTSKVSVSTASTVSVAITTTDPTTLCSGGTVTMHIFKPIPGYIYQWKNNGVNIPGATGYSYAATTSGIYTVTGTASCGTGTSNTIAVSIGSFAAQVTPSGNVAMCSGGTLTLTANTGTGFTYQWMNNGIDIPGANSATLVVTTSGSYSVAMTSPCGNGTSSATTVVLSTVTASITPAGTSTVCAATAQTFTANTGAGYTYKWYRNNVLLSATGATYTTTSDGSYKVEVSINGSCAVVSNTAILTVINNPTPTITASGPTTFCNGGSVTLTANTFTGVTYQWQKNAVNIPGATGQSYVATTTGSYRAQETKNGCSKFTPKKNVTVNNCARTGGPDFSEVAQAFMRVSPNPFTDVLSVTIATTQTEQTLLQIVDVLGKVQFSQKINTNSTIDLNPQLPPGIYLVTAVVEGEQKTFRVVKGN